MHYLIIGIIIGIILIMIIYTLVTFNSLIKKKNRVKEAFATMDVYLKKRWDLIPNLVETIKGCVKHESATLEKIVNLRNGIYDNMSLEEKIKTNENINNTLSKIMALSEDYPDLKASDTFLDLSATLTKIEDDIANARKYYNGTVRLYNNEVEMFPSNIIAKLFGYKVALMFAIAEAQRENIKIKL